MKRPGWIGFDMCVVTFEFIFDFSVEDEELLLGQRLLLDDARRRRFLHRD